LFNIQYAFSAARTPFPSTSTRSFPIRTGASESRRTEPFNFTRPARISSVASDREQNPIFDSARANPVFFPRVSVGLSRFTLVAPFFPSFAMLSLMNSRPDTIDAYLATLTPRQRAFLQKLRKLIHSIAPKAQECITYSMPGFRQNSPLVAFAAFKNHYSLFPMGGATIEKFKHELKGFATDKGTIRFTEEKPLPASLVRKIVKHRLTMDAEKAAAKKVKKKKAR
jgi:uncharacterized protein YdhG (YjbR/CyaY superfamily)